jgi:hypothetical protein
MELLLVLRVIEGFATSPLVEEIFRVVTSNREINLTPPLPFIFFTGHLHMDLTTLVDEIVVAP